MKKVFAIALLLTMVFVAVAPTATFAQDGGEETLVTLEGRVVTNSAVAVRAEASLSADTLGTLESGDVVPVLEQGELFTLIQFEGGEGYVFSDNLVVSSVLLNVSATVATNSELAIRSVPEISGAVVDTLESGAPIGVLRILPDGVWAEVYSADAVGFVFASQVRIDTESTTALDFLLDRVRFATNSLVAVRAEPAVFGELLGTFESGTTALAFAEEGVFTQVLLDDGTFGWVFTDNLRSTDAAGVVTAARVRFRSTPDISSDENIIRVLGEGEEVTIVTVTPDNLWFAIETADGEQGYVSTSFVETDAYDLTIAGIAGSNDDFSTLLTAVLAADPAVAEALAGEGPLTVFAPTNDAFAALGDETLNAVLADQEQLTNILLYHVIAGNVLSGDVIALAGNAGEFQVDSLLAGDTLTVTVDADGNVFVDGIQVIAFDIQATNGVIHVIEGVLLPDGE